jgi:hypothetical protein
VTGLTFRAVSAKEIDDEHAPFSHHLFYGKPNLVSFLHAMIALLLHIREFDLSVDAARNGRQVSVFDKSIERNTKVQFMLDSWGMNSYVIGIHGLSS